YRGTIHFTSTASPLADLPPDYTFQASDGGEKSFSVTLNKAGSKRVGVADILKKSLKRSVSMRVSAGVASAFLITGFPIAAKMGVQRSFVVTAIDAYGNRATNYQGTVQFSVTGAAE